MTSIVDAIAYDEAHARLYDACYAEKPYAHEAEFIRQCLTEHGCGPPAEVLELACGTGAHALVMEALGYKVTASDASESMLLVARRKAAAAGARVAFERVDMRRIEFRPTMFHAAICLFDSIGYVCTNHEIMRTFKGVRRALKPGGLFVFEFWHAGAMLRGYDPVRVREFSCDGGRVVRISRTRLDYLRQVAEVNIVLHELLDDGNYRITEETHVNRFFLVQEMATLLERAAFEPLRWYAGYARDDPITGTTWHVLCVARSPGGSHPDVPPSAARA